MTGLLLVRHASVDGLGRVLAGRTPGIHLHDRGRAEADALARSLADVPIRAVHAGPLDRARETAAPLAAIHGLDPTIDPAFDEVDFGVWTGVAFQELDAREDWRRWNEQRATARPPGGESMADVLDRALSGVRALRAAHGEGRVVVVSHGDVIRPLIAHFLGLHLDHLLRFEVAPASISAVSLEDAGARVLAVNRTIGPPWAAP